LFAHYVPYMPGKRNLNGSDIDGFVPLLLHDNVCELDNLLSWLP